MKSYFWIPSNLSYHLKNHVRPEGLILTHMEVFQYETPFTSPRTVVMTREQAEDEESFFLKGPARALENNRNLADWQWHLKANADAGYQWGCITLYFGKELLPEKEIEFFQKNVEYRNHRYNVLYLAGKAVDEVQRCWAMEELRRLMRESEDPTEKILATLEVARLRGYMDEREYRGFVRHVERVLCPQ